jgi:hypothetical protein
LKAPRKLTAEEWVTMRQHSLIGYEILQCSNTPIFKMAAEIALYHHEKWDGSGYPKGLAGDNIPQSAQIVAIADVFDALTMKRSYKEAWSVEASLEEMRANSGTHFNPALLTIFLNILPKILNIKKRVGRKGLAFVSLYISTTADKQLAWHDALTDCFVIEQFVSGLYCWLKPTTVRVTKEVVIRLSFLCVVTDMYLSSGTPAKGGCLWIAMNVNYLSSIPTCCCTNLCPSTPFRNTTLSFR